jgi:hypothetical protein
VHSPHPAEKQEGKGKDTSQNERKFVGEQLWDALSLLSQGLRICLTMKKG